MKVITAFILTLVFFVVLSLWLNKNQSFSKMIKAQDHSPLDFLSDYDKFEVIVGIDTANGRYYTYHYEFNE